MHLDTKIAMIIVGIWISDSLNIQLNSRGYLSLSFGWLQFGVQLFLHS